MRSAAIGALLLTGCGQKGPLYLPDEATQVVTRPTQTPAETTPPEKGDAPPAEPGPVDEKEKDPVVPAPPEE
jgi:predicted small lipoprotein YifL